jgi:hypothetical protein
VVHQLSEDRLTEIHPSLSEVEESPALVTWRRISAEKNPNRKKRDHPQLHDPARVIPPP